MRFVISNIIIFFVLLLFIYFRYDEKRKGRWLIEAFILVTCLKIIDVFVVQKLIK
jgi:hypothetical protein